MLTVDHVIRSGDVAYAKYDKPPTYNTPTWTHVPPATKLQLRDAKLPRGTVDTIADAVVNEVPFQGRHCIASDMFDDCHTKPGFACATPPLAVDSTAYVGLDVT